MINLFVTKFADTVTVSQSATKDSVKEFVRYEKQVTRKLTEHGIRSVLSLNTDIEMYPQAATAAPQKGELTRKPAYPDVKFNATNEGGTAAVAVCRQLGDGLNQELGIDLIQVTGFGNSAVLGTDFDKLDVAYLREMMLTGSEIERIKLFPSARQRQLIYGMVISVKESFLKYHGIGLVGISAFNSVQVQVPYPQSGTVLKGLCDVVEGNEKTNGVVNWIEFEQQVFVEFVDQHSLAGLGLEGADGTGRAVARLFVIGNDSTSSSLLVGSIVSKRYPAPVRVVDVAVDDLSLH